VISVRDHGVGIPADRLERVFDVFSQVPNVSPGSQSGVGVGLSLVRSLVQLHGGSVSAASEGAGKGSTFTIRLPLVQPSARPVRQKPGNGAKDLSLRILVVDDNRDAAESMGLVLARAGADVEVANDGTSALAHLDRFHPAIILLDIGMPGLDGYEVARQIRARQATRDVMLVALTGWGQAEDRRRSFEAGFDHHLTKPAGIDELRALLPAVSHRA
jgi:CheY-like chemotaxis protein